MIILGIHLACVIHQNIFALPATEEKVTLKSQCFHLYMYTIFRVINGRFFLYFFTDGESSFVDTVTQYKIGDQHTKKNNHGKF